LLLVGPHQRNADNLARWRLVNVVSAIYAPLYRCIPNLVWAEMGSHQHCRINQEDTIAFSSVRGQAFGTVIMGGPPTVGSNCKPLQQAPLHKLLASAPASASFPRITQTAHTVIARPEASRGAIIVGAIAGLGATAWPARATTLVARRGDALNTLCAQINTAAGRRWPAPTSTM
jgi:hypothetical protein